MKSKAETQARIVYVLNGAVSVIFLAVGLLLILRQSEQSAIISSIKQVNPELAAVVSGAMSWQYSFLIGSVMAFFVFTFANVLLFWLAFTAMREEKLSILRETKNEARRVQAEKTLFDNYLLKNYK